jgi:subtilisin family serine protease
MLRIKSVHRAALKAALVSATMLYSGGALAAVIGESLQEKLAAASATDTFEVIVTFDSDGPLTSGQVGALQNLGLKGLTLHALPMAGVVATKAQIEALNANSQVRSLWLNEQLAYDNEIETALTGVDRMRADSNLRNNLGLPYSGKGVGILINDSGVDGQHPDLAPRMAQNVAAQTNLRSLDSMLPITYTEGVPDTDIVAGGHGTHVTGITGGTGAQSGGAQEGVAPGSHVIGYGSGAALFILDTLGAFDYALVNQFRYNIRIVANSFGSTGDIGTPFNPDDPTNIATKKLTDRNIVVVISAGNSGSGEDTITGNFKKAPWIITVAAGDNSGNLAGFSSRGKRGGGGTVVVDGETFEWFDRPWITAPGVDVISTRAKGDVLSTPDPAAPFDTTFYTTFSGTSMASPHISGTVALMLEANPQLGWREVKQILKDTATNMQGRADWEVGAGYVNVHAAVAAAAGKRTDYGKTPIVNRTFVANVLESRIDGPNLSLNFNPVGPRDVRSFNVAAGLSTVVASAVVSDNTVAIVLIDPNGNRYGSAISLPLLGPKIGVTAPAVPGTWTVEIRGIGSVSGVALDPLRLTNGTALPDTIPVDIDFFRVDGFSGLNDVAGHPAQGFIERGVSERLIDSRAGGFYQPDALITRAELGDYLTQGAEVRQFRPTNGSNTFSDTIGDFQLAVAEAVTARGAAMRDGKHVQNGVVKKAGASTFNPDGSVNRAELAYTLVQSLGLQAEAEATRVNLVGQKITVAFGDQRIPLEDDASVPADLRGYVQLALDLQLMNAKFQLVQGPFDFTPTLKAFFEPAADVNRGSYAFSAVNLFDRLNQAQ